MKEIYSSSGKINIEPHNNYYLFYNNNTAMTLRLYKEDIPYFMNIGIEKRFSTNVSYSNFMTDYEKKSIKSYLRIKNKRLSKIKTLIDNGEKLEDIINIMPLKSLIEYMGDNEWKNL